MRKTYCDITNREVAEDRELYHLTVLDSDDKPAFPFLEISAHFKEELRKWLGERAAFYAKASA